LWGVQITDYRERCVIAMKEKAIGRGWKLIGTKKRSGWRRLVDPNGREYRPEDVDKDCRVRMMQDGAGKDDRTLEASREFSRWLIIGG